jgi:hypothetical protein
MEIDEEYYDEILNDFIDGDRIPRGLSIGLHRYDILKEIDIDYVLVVESLVGASKLSRYDKMIWTVCTRNELSATVPF